MHTHAHMCIYNKYKEIVLKDNLEIKSSRGLGQQGNALALISSMIEKESSHKFEAKIEDSYERIASKGKESVAMKDAYGNSLLSIGQDDKSAKFSNYTFTNDTLNWPLWLALYNESWVFKRAIDKPAQDEVRCGITINNNTQKKDDVIKRYKGYHDDLIQLLSWGALFGGSLAFIMYDNFTDEDYKKPFNKEKAKKAKVMKLYIVDRWYGVAPDYNHTVESMADCDYGKPKFYNVTMADGKTYRYHHDYVIRYEHRFAPKLVKNGMLQGWGYSEGSHIMNELCRDEKLKTTIQSLMDKSLIEVIKMTGMRGVFMGADSENEEQLTKRLEMVNWGRNFNSLTFLDSSDSYEMNSFTGLAGLSDILQQNMWQISAAVEMQGVLFGDLKNGFSTDIDAMKRYDGVIHGRCESYLRPVLDKLLKYIYIMLGVDEVPDYEFNSLLSTEQTKEKLESIKDFAALCSTMMNDGVLTPKQYAKAMQTYVVKGLIDFGLTDEAIEQIDDNVALEMEGIDLDKADDDEEKEESNIIGGSGRVKTPGVHEKEIRI